MYYVYVLKSEKDGTTYIGSTEDLERRIEEHNSGKTKSIKHKLPMELVYYEAYLTKSMALSRENKLKRNSFAKEQLYERLFK
jgi:putative endonuclease